AAASHVAGLLCRSGAADPARPCRMGARALAPRERGRAQDAAGPARVLRLAAPRRAQPQSRIRRARTREGPGAAASPPFPLSGAARAAPGERGGIVKKLALAGACILVGAVLAGCGSSGGSSASTTETTATEQTTTSTTTTTAAEKPTVV